MVQRIDIVCIIITDELMFYWNQALEQSCKQLLELFRPLRNSSIAVHNKRGVTINSRRNRNLFTGSLESASYPVVKIEVPVMIIHNKKENIMLF